MARELGGKMSVIEENLRLGGDPQGHEHSAALGWELAKLNHPARPDMDWARVERLCLALFREQGVELQSVSAFALARAQLHGLQGLYEGVSLIERLLDRDWDRLWPPALPVRREILEWLFAQLRPWLRGVPLSVADVPDLLRQGEQLKGLAELLDRRAQAPLVPLQALRSQLLGLLKRLAPETVVGPVDMPVAAESAAEPLAVTSNEVAPATVNSAPLKARRRARKVPGDLPAVVVLKLDSADPPSTRNSPRTRWPLRLWLLLLAVLMALTGLFAWAYSHYRWQDMWTVAAPSALSSPVGERPSETEPPAGPSTPIRLDGQLLFPAGKAQLRPESTKVLINSLINVKAQPGWLIVITGHSDSTGDVQRNVELSRNRAAAVRDWMQRMGDIPDDCFVVRGAGASEPVASDDTGEGRNANRRVEITLTPEGGACTKK
ncbi:MAG: flagellar motor protein MotB [Pseudomonas sp.]|nr:MAG: flagellar motor protein MotB [Pseudomonas sp.]